MDDSPKSEPVAALPADAPPWKRLLQHPKVRRLVRHPIFPLMVLVTITQFTRDQFPFSHYPMYSMPTSRPLKWQYMADGEGKPLAHVYHTGISPSQVGKMFGGYKHDFATEEEAALEVLKYLRQKNTQRPKRPLPERIQLIETKVGFGDGHFIETNTVVAEHVQSKKEKR
jgi:hypothetical protein